MDSALKQRLIGAAVLVLLAVIFLPMLITGPAPDGSKDMQGVPNGVPAVPDAQVDSRDLDFATAEPATAVSSAPPSYMVDFGKYATANDAKTVVDALKAAGLDKASYRSVNADGRTLQQIFIGPYGSSADAETARQSALKLSDIDGSRVIAINTATPSPATATVAEPAPANVAKPDEAPPANDVIPATPPTTSVASAPEVKKPAPKPEPKPEPKPKPEPAKVQPASNGPYTLVLGSSAYPARSEALHKKAAEAGIKTVLYKTRNEKGQPIVVVRTAPISSKEKAEALKAEVALKLQRTSTIQKL